MSSMEERREARRRRRQQQEEEAASDLSTVNGEDDLERRRRERREARLRQAAEQEEERSSRRSRRRQEEDTPAEDTSSYRSRRRRGQEEEEETPAAEEPKPEEDTSSSQAAEEDSAAAEAAAEEARRRREEEEEERRQAAEAEKRRQQQEEARKREEEERRKREEEEERKRQMVEEDTGFSETYQHSSMGGGIPKVENLERWHESCLNVRKCSDKEGAENFSLSFEEEGTLVETVEKEKEETEGHGQDGEEGVTSVNTSMTVVTWSPDSENRGDRGAGEIMTWLGTGVRRGGDGTVDKIDLGLSEVVNISHGEDPSHRFINDIFINQLTKPFATSTEEEGSSVDMEQGKYFPQEDFLSRPPVSPEASLDAASIERHLDHLTSDDQLSHDSSSDLMEMHGLMEEYERLINTDSEDDTGQNLRAELAEAIAADEVLGANSLEVPNSHLSSCTEDGEIPEPVYLMEDFSNDYTYNVERETCESDCSSYKDYCLSVFDSSNEYDRPAVSHETYTVETGPGSEDVEQRQNVPRLLLPSDLNASSMLASSDRKEVDDTHNHLDSGTSEDITVSFVQSSQSDHSDVTSEDNVLHTYCFLNSSEKYGNGNGNKESDQALPHAHRKEPEFDEDILPRVADEELENDELGEDVLFFIPGAVGPVPDNQEPNKSNYQMNSCEQTGHSASNQLENISKDILKNKSLTKTEEFTLFYMGISGDDQGKTVQTSNQTREDKSAVQMYEPSSANQDKARTRVLADSQTSCVSNGSGAKAYSLFRPVLMEIIHRGNHMQENITFELKDTKYLDKSHNNADEVAKLETLVDSVGVSCEKTKTFQSPVLPVSKCCPSSPQINSPRGMDASTFIKDSASSCISKFVTQTKNEEMLMRNRTSVAEHMKIVRALCSNVPNVPPVLKSWKSKCEATAAEQEDSDAHKNPVIHKAFGQVVSQLKKQKENKASKKKLYSKFQKELCKTDLVEHFAEVKVMGILSPKTEVNDIPNSSQVMSSTENCFIRQKTNVSHLTEELDQLAAMKSVTGDFIDASVKPVHPRKMLDSFLRKQCEKTIKSDLETKHFLKQQVTSKETHKSVVDKVSMFQSVDDRNQPNTCRGSPTLSIKQNLSNLLNDLKNKDRSSLSESSSASTSQETTPRTPREPKSNFLKQRRLSLIKKEKDSIDGQTADEKFLFQASQVEKKLANLLKSMGNKASQSSVSQDKREESTVVSSESLSESSRSFFEKQNPSENAVMTKPFLVESFSGSQRSLSFTSEKDSSETDLPKEASNDTRPSKLNAQVNKEKIKNIPLADTNKNVKNCASVHSSCAAEISQCNYQSAPEQTYLNLLHGTASSSLGQWVCNEKKTSLVTTHNIQCEGLNFHADKTTVTTTDSFKDVFSRESDVVPITTNQPTTSQPGPVPQISSYLKVKSFQMLAESFDDEIANLSISEDNSDLHLNLSDLSDTCNAHSTPRSLPFFRNSSSFFCPTPRSDRDDMSSISSPHVSNRVAKAWGADGPKEITIEIKPSQPCTEVLLNEEKKMEEERLERERQEKEEAARRKEEEEKKKKGKRKGLGGLSPEKKKLLKRLIMQKAAEDLRNEAKKKAEEKERYINERVPVLKTEGMNQADLQGLCKDFHAKVCALEEDVFDWEIKIRKQEFEINELTLKVNDTKGKFIKPVLRKVNKTESKLAKLDKKESRDFRSNLKSTGQNKFALDEKEEAKTPDWRQSLKGKGEGEGEEAAAES